MAGGATADLPGTALDQIVWNLPNVFRLLALGAVVICLLSQAMLLSHYWLRVMPLREEIRGNEVVAPPVYWTFGYHLIVGLLVLFVGLGIGQSAVRNAPPTVLTFAAPVLIFGLSVTVHFFVRYYSDSLNAEQSRRMRR